MMKHLATHPNVGAVLLVSLGCEGFDRDGLSQAIASSGRPVETIIIQSAGGTRATIDRGVVALEQLLKTAAKAERVQMSLSDLTVGTICGGSDGTSGIHC